MNAPDPKLLDQFFTPPELARAIVQRCRWRGLIYPGCTVLEPSAGTGSFVDAVQALEPTARIVANELDPRLIDRWRHRVHRFRQGDFLTMEPIAVDLVLGNPPFGVREYRDGKVRLVREIASAHVDHARRFGPCLFLLLQQFLGSNARLDWLTGDGRPTRIDQITPRPGFTQGGGGDMRDYVTVHWARGRADATQFDWLRWEKPRRSSKGKGNASSGRSSAT